MSRKKKVKFVPPPPQPIPAWLPLYESRAKAAGFDVQRCESTEPGWWLNVQAPTMITDRYTCKVAIFGPRKYILNAGVQDLPPRDLVKWAEMAVEIISHVMPEAFELPPREPEPINVGSFAETPF